MRKEKEKDASGREVQVLSSLDSVSTDDFFWLGCGDKLIDYGSESCLLCECAAASFLW